MRSKPQRHRPYRSLQQLPIPERLWNSISMDFIEKLPSFSGFDTILVIVDRLSKQAIFISTHHFNGTSTSFCYSCLLKAWSSISCYVQSWLWICLSFLLLPRYSPRYEASRYQWIPSGGKRSSGTNQSDVGTVSPHILQLPTGQLVGTIAPSWICIQQCS